MSNDELRHEVERLRSRVAELESALATSCNEAQRSSLALRELISIFDSIDEPVYVADPDTYEILYVNQATRTMWGEGLSQKCYRYLQGRDEPCPFCTNDRLFGKHLGQPYIWEFQNELSGHWFRCIDKAIPWPDGRTVRYEMAIDITDRKQIEESLRQTRERLELAIEGARLGTWDWDLSTGEMTPNAQMAQMLGYSVDELTRRLRQWESFVHAEDLPEVKQELHAHLEGRTAYFETERRLLTSSGTLRWTLIRGKVVQRDEQGAPLRMSGTILDIHDQKVFQEELRQSEQRYREYLQKFEAIAMRIDLNHKFVFMHGAVEAITGYRSEDFTSGRVAHSDIIAPEDKERVLKAIARFANFEDESYETEYRIIRQDGTIGWIHDSFKLARDPNGVPVAYEGVVYDVTERKQMEQSLQEVKQRLELVIEAAELGTLDWNLTTGEVVPNAQGAKMLGYTLEEFLPRTQAWETLMHEEDVPVVKALMASHLRGEIPAVELEYRARTKQGEWRWRLVRGRVVERDPQGKPLRAVATVMDVTERKRNEEALRRAHDELEQRVAQRTAELATANTALRQKIAERKQAEEALRQSEETARALLNVATESAILINLDSTIVTLNETAAQRLGGSIDELVGRPCIDLMPPELVSRRRIYAEQVIRTGRPVRFQDEYNGRFCDNNVHPVLDAEENVVRLAIFTRDITEIKIAEEEVRKEQQLLHQLLDFQEQERQLVAYEIHDGLAQELTGAIFRFQAFRELLAINTEEAWNAFDTGLSLLTEGIKETRSLISGLRPPILDELGIVAAIEYLVCECQEQGGPRVEFHHNLEDSPFPSTLEIAIFRIVQESLTNARHHSQSDRVKLTLLERDGRLQIDVRDWGVGFDPTKVKARHFGLEGLRERARLLGGLMIIDTKPGQGTHLHVELPLSKPPSGNVDSNEE
ncbi:MAG: PAS domain-containing protein [Pirellulales bacterium]|nr:PAS domain-containing protein [Pirellulales bacterium]